MRSWKIAVVLLSGCVVNRIDDTVIGTTVIVTATESGELERGATRSR